MRDTYILQAPKLYLAGSLSAYLLAFKIYLTLGAVPATSGVIFADSLFQLWSLIPADKREAYLTNKNTDTAPVLDLLPLGYSKVLGKGRIPEIPLVVRARYVSKEAERKIKEAGGVVELVA